MLREKRYCFFSGKSLLTIKLLVFHQQTVVNAFYVRAFCRRELSDWKVCVVCVTYISIHKCITITFEQDIPHIHGSLCIHERWAIGLSQRLPRCAHMYECPENFRESLTMPTATFHEPFHGLFFRLMLWICVKKLKFVALPVHEIIEGIQKIGQSLDMLTLPFLRNLVGFWANGRSVRMDPGMFWPIWSP